MKTFKVVLKNNLQQKKTIEVNNSVTVASILEKYLHLTKKKKDILLKFGLLEMDPDKKIGEFDMKDGDVITVIEDRFFYKVPKKQEEQKETLVAIEKEELQKENEPLKQEKEVEIEKEKEIEKKKLEETIREKEKLQNLEEIAKFMENEENKEKMKIIEECKQRCQIVVNKLKTIMDRHPDLFTPYFYKEKTPEGLAKARLLAKDVILTQVEIMYHTYERDYMDEKLNLPEEASKYMAREQANEWVRNKLEEWITGRGPPKVPVIGHFGYARGFTNAREDSGWKPPVEDDEPESFEFPEVMNNPKKETEEVYPVIEEPKNKDLSEYFYEGEMLNGLPDGLGKFYRRDGSLFFEGMFSKGVYGGKGTYYLENGDTLIGEFYGDKFLGTYKGKEKEAKLKFVKILPFIFTDLFLFLWSVK